MKSRGVQILLVATLLVPFAGCPTSSDLPIRLGEWNFEVDEDGTLYPVIIRANGTAEVPQDAAAEFFGTLTWSQDNTGFKLNQQISTSVWVYSAATPMRTSMAGIITGPNTGTWTATFVK